MQIGIVAHEKASHDGCNSVRGVVFGIFATASGVVVLDEIFEYASEEVVVFGERLLEREIDKFIDQSTSKRGALGRVGNKLSERFE